MNKRLLPAAFLMTGMTASAFADDINGTIRVEWFDSDRQALKEVKVPMIHAIEVASAKTEGLVTDAELEEEDGYLVYEIKILDANNNKTEVLVDPVTAGILKVEKDD